MYKIINFPTLSSTNQYIKENYKTLDEYSVIVTEEQTNGKGRLGRTWISHNDDLTFSILLKPNLDSSKIPLISLVAGLSICNVINKYINCEIKWPNDIIVNDKKIAGILVEAVSSNTIDCVVVGIGININGLEYSKDLIMKATSLRLELNNIIDKQNILIDILEQFDIIYQELINNNLSFINNIRKYNYLKDKEVYINNEKVKVLDINNKGNLIILDKEETKEIYFGEVTLNNIYKK